MKQFVLYIPSLKLYLTEPVHAGKWSHDSQDAHVFKTKSEARKIRDRHWDECLGVEVVELSSESSKEKKHV